MPQEQQRRDPSEAAPVGARKLEHQVQASQASAGVSQRAAGRRQSAAPAAAADSGQARAGRRRRALPRAFAHALGGLFHAPLRCDSSRHSSRFQYSCPKRANQSSNRTAAARESSLSLPALLAAIVVVKRSSKSSTGTPGPSAERSLSAKARASRVWSESAPESESGKPTTTRSTPRCSTSSRSCLMPAFVSGRKTGSIGVAKVPVGSLRAQPQRAEPWSSARTLTARRRAPLRRSLPQVQAPRRASLGPYRRPGQLCLDLPRPRRPPRPQRRRHRRL